MFQFAFAMLMARKLKTAFLLDTNFQHFELGYFKLFGYSKLLRNAFVLRVYNFFQKKIKPKNNYDFKDCFQEHSYDNLPKSANIDGYFQDHRLYINHREELAKIFTVKTKFRKVYDEKYHGVQQKKRTIVISFRFGDYASFDLFNGKDLIIPISWYEDVLNGLELSDAVIFCISDDIHYVEANFCPNHKNLFFVKDDMVTQLLLLKNADICIISNSTFAWWGAFLNDKAQAIYCPQYFLGFPVSKEIPPHIYPENWTKVPVTTQ